MNRFFVLPNGSSFVLTVVVIFAVGCSREFSQELFKAIAPEHDRDQLKIPPRMIIADFLKWQPSDFFDTKNELELCNAISTGDMIKVKSQVDSGMDLNVDGKFGIRVLYWAFIEENMEAFKFLLERGADPDRRLTENIVIKRVAKPPRCDAFFSGDSIFFTSLRCWKSEFCTAALAYSKNVHQLDRNGSNLVDVFMWPGYGFGGKENLKALIDVGIDLNGKDHPPIYTALCFHRADLCLQLLEAGADPQKLDGNVGDLAAYLEIELWREKQGEHDASLDPLVDWLDTNYRKIRRQKP